jgi:hypothetical protein
MAVVGWDHVENMIRIVLVRLMFETVERCELEFELKTAIRAENVRCEDEIRRRYTDDVRVSYIM